jgi:arabinogalactan oligomer/maltooligosaccharide transport system substrate-binding protein
MKKGLIILIHLMAVITIIVVLGVSSIKTPPPSDGTVDPRDRFTGEIERNVTLQVLENDIAVKNGYLSVLKADFEEAYKEYNIKIEDAMMSEHSDLEKDGPYGFGPDVLYQANDQLMRYVDG